MFVILQINLYQKSQRLQQQLNFINNFTQMAAHKMQQTKMHKNIPLRRQSPDLSPQNRNANTVQPFYSMKMEKGFNNQHKNTHIQPEKHPSLKYKTEDYRDDKKHVNNFQSNKLAYENNQNAKQQQFLTNQHRTNNKPQEQRQEQSQQPMRQILQKVDQIYRVVVLKSQRNLEDGKNINSSNEIAELAQLNKKLDRIQNQIQKQSENQANFQKQLNRLEAKSPAFRDKDQQKVVIQDKKSYQVVISRVSQINIAQGRSCRPQQPNWGANKSITQSNISVRPSLRYQVQQIIDILNSRQQGKQKQQKINNELSITQHQYSPTEAHFSNRRQQQQASSKQKYRPNGGVSQIFTQQSQIIANQSKIFSHHGNNSHSYNHEKIAVGADYKNGSSNFPAGNMKTQPDIDMRQKQKQTQVVSQTRSNLNPISKELRVKLYFNEKSPNKKSHSQQNQVVQQLNQLDNTCVKNQLQNILISKHNSIPNGKRSVSRQKDQSNKISQKEQYQKNRLANKNTKNSNYARKQPIEAAQSKKNMAENQINRVKRMYNKLKQLNQATKIIEKGLDISQVGCQKYTPQFHEYKSKKQSSTEKKIQAYDDHNLKQNQTKKKYRSPQKSYTKSASKFPNKPKQTETFAEKITTPKLGLNSPNNRRIETELQIQKSKSISRSNSPRFYKQYSTTSYNKPTFINKYLHNLQPEKLPKTPNNGKMDDPKVRYFTNNNSDVNHGKGTSDVSYMYKYMKKPFQQGAQNMKTYSRQKYSHPSKSPNNKNNLKKEIASQLKNPIGTSSCSNHNHPSTNTMKGGCNTATNQTYPRAQFIKIMLDQCYVKRFLSEKQLNFLYDQFCVQQIPKYLWQQKTIQKIFNKIHQADYII